MKKIFLKFIVFFFGLLGISTISAGCMYGGVPAIYKLSGSVVDKETSQPIENAKIEFLESYDAWSNDTGYWEIITPEIYRSCYDDCFIFVIGSLQFVAQTVNLTLTQTEDDVYEQHNILIEMEKLPPEKN